MGSSVSKASTSSSEINPVQLPRGYEVLKVLGEGYFGKVLKCWKKDIKQTVAVKIPKCFENDTVNEVGGVDFDVHSCKRYCIVRGALSASCKQAITFPFSYFKLSTKVTL